MNIRTILIDDEKKAVALLHNKIKEYVPFIDVVGEAFLPSDGAALIEELKPDLVFLDVNMPQQNGFDMLQTLNYRDFEVIFVTAYDEYAISAIENMASGYLLKPLDSDKLKKVAEQTKVKIEQKKQNQTNAKIIEFFNQGITQNKLVVPTALGMDMINVQEILYCEGAGGYTKIHIRKQETKLSSKSIGYYADLLMAHNFCQIHKSYIINLEYVTQYLSEGTVVLNYDISLPVSKTKKNKFLDNFR